MNPKRIVIDGKVYNSVEEMPDDVRRNYEEAMRGFTKMNAENFSGALNDINNIFADKITTAHRIFWRATRRSI